MGWLFRAGLSRQDLIADRTKGWERTKDDGSVIKSSCIAHCYRGGVFSGVLWSVWERTFTKDGQPFEPTQRWIVCDLLKCERGEWGYKGMDESMHPYFYSCPLKYLDMVPIENLAGMPNGVDSSANTTPGLLRNGVPAKPHGNRDVQDTHLNSMRQANTSRRFK